MSPSTPSRSERRPDDHPLTIAERAVVRRRLAEADGAFLATDFDGTIAAIRDDPGAAQARPDARDALQSLADRARADVAVVSGRALADVRDRVGVDAAYAGNHGLEIEPGSATESAEERYVHPAAERARSQLRRAGDRLRERLADVEGAFLEDKGLTATVHYRRVDDDRAVDRVRSLAREIAREYDAIDASEGKRIVELAPAVDWDKGRALEWLLEAVPGAEDRHPIYLGDDVTDEDAFEALEDGTTIAVGRDPAATAAEFVVADSADAADVLAWLDGLLERDRPLAAASPAGGL